MCTLYGKGRVRARVYLGQVNIDYLIVLPSGHKK